jgi:hypothetical protein
MYDNRKQISNRIYMWNEFEGIRDRGVWSFMF